MNSLEMIRLKDEEGYWVDEIIPNSDGSYCIFCNKLCIFAKLFEENEPIIKDLVDDGFEIVK